MKSIHFLILLLLSLSVSAQDLDSLLMEDTKNNTQYVFETFKSTRVINGHSIERMTNGNLDFRIGHRFGAVNSGPYEFFGLDQSTVMLALDYGVTDWLMVGIARASMDKTVNGYLKLSLLRQSTGDKNMPISLSWYTATDVYGMKWADNEKPAYITSRLSFVNQLLIARKFNEKISLQLSPTYIHINLVDKAIDLNNLYCMGLGGRYKLARRLTFNAEYFYVARPSLTGVHNNPNSFSMGFDIETGGHVFTILLTNSLGILDKQFINETTGTWKNGDIHLGFTISRVFGLKSVV